MNLKLCEGLKTILAALAAIAFIYINTGLAWAARPLYTKATEYVGPCKKWCVGDPINAGGGNLYEEHTDYQSAGAFPLVFFRAYNSVIADAGKSPDGAEENLGRGWYTNLDQHLFSALVPLPPGATKPGPCIINGVAYFCPPADPSSNRPYQIDITIWNKDGSQGDFIYQGTGAPRIRASFRNLPGSTGELRVASVSAKDAVTRYLYLRDDGTKELYGADGKLLSVTDQNGLQQKYYYDVRGRLISVTGPFGRKLVLEYDIHNRVKTLITPAGGTISYQYNAIGNLVSVRYPDNSQLKYEYENRNFPHALTSIIDQDGNRYVMWSYDKEGRAITSALADGTDQVRVVYNADGSTDVIEPGGPTRHLTFKSIYYAEEMATSSAPCDGCNIKSITYDKNGFISSETDFQGHVTHFKNSSEGLELSRTENAGTGSQRTVTTQWNRSLQAPALMHTGQSTLAFNYDSRGRLLTLHGTDKGGKTIHQVQFKYSPKGLLLSETDPDGAVTKYSYDTQGNIASITGSSGEVVQMPTYDANGNPLTIIGPTGIKTNLVYDSMQRITSRSVGSSKIEYHYDRVGQLIKINTADGAYIDYHYDVSHRLISMSDNLGDTVEYKLDARGNNIGERVYNKRNGTLMPPQIIAQMNKVLIE